MSENPFESPKSLEENVSSPIVTHLERSLFYGGCYGLLKFLSSNDNWQQSLKVAGISTCAFFAASMTLEGLKEYNLHQNFKIGLVSSLSFFVLKYYLPELPPQDIISQLEVAAGLFATGFLGTEIYKRTKK